MLGNTGREIDANCQDVGQEDGLSDGQAEIVSEEKDTADTSLQALSELVDIDNFVKQDNEQLEALISKITTELM